MRGLKSPGPERKNGFEFSRKACYSIMVSSSAANRGISSLHPPARPYPGEMFFLFELTAHGLPLLHRH